MAVVMDYYEGKTHIKIDDEYCVKTKEEVDAILKHVGNIYINYLIDESNKLKKKEV